MKKSALVALLNSTTQEGPLQLPSDLLQIPNFQNSFIKQFEALKLVLNDVQINADELHIQASSEYWDTEVNIDLQFYIKGSKVHYKLEMVFPDDWDITDSWPNFKHNKAAPLLQQSKLVFISSDQIPDLEILDNFEREPQLYFFAEQPVEGALKPIEWLLGEAPTLQLAGPVTIENDLPDMELVVHISETTKLDFFNNIPIAFAWQSEVLEVPDSNGSEYFNRVYYEITAFIPFEGKEIRLISHFVNELGALNFKAEFDDITLNQLTKLNSLSNDANLTEALPRGLKLGNKIGLKEINISLLPKKKKIASIEFVISTVNPWDVMYDIEGDNIELSIAITNPGRKTQREIEVFLKGDLAFGNKTTLNLSASYPDQIVTATLAEDSTIPISESVSYTHLTLPTKA